MMYVFPFDIQIEGLHVENCSKKKSCDRYMLKLKETKKGRKKLKNTNFT